MKAVVIEKPKTLAIKDIPVPKVATDQVLVRVQASSLCNLTDWHIYEGTFDGGHDHYPQVLGHELCGEVVEAGSAVQSCRVGDRVVMYSSSGAFCEYVAFSPDTWGYWTPLPSGLSNKVGTLCEMIHGAYVGCVYPASVRDTDDVLVIGQGPMGLTVMQFAALHARSITTIDMFENRLAMSSKLGADYTYNRSGMSAGDIVKTIRDKTGGVSLAIMCIDMDLTDERDAFDLAVEAIRPNGRLTGLNVFVKNVNHRMNPAKLIQKNIHMRHELALGPMELDPKNMVEVFRQGCQFVADGQVQMEPLITHKIGFDGVEDALRLCYDHPEQVIKVLVS